MTNRSPRRARGTMLALGVALAATTLFAMIAQPPTSAGTPYAAPGADAVLGRDHLGRDIFTGLAASAVRSVHLPIAAACILLLTGTLVGILIGLSGPWIRAGVLRVLESMLLVPPIVTALVVVSGLGASDVALVVCVLVIGFAMVTRVIATATVQIAVLAHVEMAFGAGTSTLGVAFHEILPRLNDLLRAEAGIRVIQALQLTAAIQFLGFGGGSSWGGMVLNGLPGFTLNPWATLGPGIALAAMTALVVLTLDQRAGVPA